VPTRRAAGLVAAILALTPILAGSAAGAQDALPSPVPVASTSPAASDPEGERIFEAVRHAWDASGYPRYTTYTVGVKYQKGTRWITRHYATYEDMRRNLVFARDFSPEEEADPKVPHGTSIAIGPIVLNPDHPEDPIGPLALGINQDYGISPAGHVIKALNDAEDVANASELPVIGTTSTKVRDYDVRLIGTETASDGALVDHLGLTPLHDPKRLKLREMWVDAKTYVVRSLLLASNFNGSPLSGVSWRVDYRIVDGAPYLETEKAQAPVTYRGQGTLRDVTIAFTDVQELGHLPWSMQIGLHPGAWITDP
jgi:hypothetical protein